MSDTQHTDFCDCGYPGIREVQHRTILMNDYDVDRYSDIFRYTGGSSNIETDLMEEAILRHGYVALAPYAGKLWSLQSGHPGGEQSYQYRPRRFIGANPYIEGGWEYDLEIGKECTLIRNDLACRGILPLVTHYNFLRATNELSMYIAMINSRAETAFEAGNDADAAAVELWMRDLEAGHLKAIVGTNILQKVQALPFASKTEQLTDLIEMEQYQKAAAFNELGQNANYNMKRESINSGEAQMNQDALMPLVMHMYNQRKKALQQANELFSEYMDLGPMSVELTGTWKQKADLMQRKPGAIPMPNRKEAEV